MIGTDYQIMTYPPLSVLKPVADNIWIVDGPLIRFGMPWPKMPFPTRMTVIRLSDGIFLHSPIAPSPDLLSQVKELGEARWIVAPNRIHYAWVEPWAQAFAEAQIYLAPRIEDQASRPLKVDGLPLDRDNGYPWDGQLFTLPITGHFMTEVEFFHPLSRTLVLTDLVENFESNKLPTIWLRWLTWFGGVQDPHGSMPRDMRITFRRSRNQLRAAVETMLSWHPQRIIVAHGRCYDDEGERELRRAFEWLLN